MIVVAFFEWTCFVVETKSKFDFSKAFICHGA